MNAKEKRLVQLALKGRILTPVYPEEVATGAWTEFSDKWAGGCAKEPWDHIFIQAKPTEACRVFEAVFEHSPRAISCSCCGEEYFIGQATDVVYEVSLFIKAADILSEWKAPSPQWLSIEDVKESFSEITVTGPAMPPLYKHWVEAPTKPSKKKKL